MIGPRRFRAPRQHGAVLAEPPLGHWGDLLTRNQQPSLTAPSDLLGTPLADLRRQARRAALAAAQAYLRQRGEPVPELADRRAETLLLAGHQPELFHPGVWVKNFALNGLARAHGAIPVNLVIDTDAVKATALAVPGWESAAPPPRCDPAAVRRLTIPFDRWTNETPYEERPVLDAELFDSLPARAAPFMKGWGFTPLLARFWEEVLARLGRGELLGERLVGARRAFERHWGCHNLEVPMSRLCQTGPFLHFACHLLAHLPRFHADYNACVHAYRRANGIRSRFHPVPDLAAEGEWLEAPFWAWERGRPRRARLFARPGPEGIALRIGAVAGPTLPLGKGDNPGAALARWQEWEQAGFKVRSRALTTTLYARLFLADLFIHGIGGGKYDEITDALVRRFYQTEPPGYAVLSATLLLPLPAYSAEPGQCKDAARALRDVRWNPQRHLPAADRTAPEVRKLVEEKRTAMAARPADAAGRRRRFEELRALTARLRTSLADRATALREQVRRCEEEVRANAILRRRDYAFCLYPEEGLRDFLTAFL